MRCLYRFALRIIGGAAWADYEEREWAEMEPLALYIVGLLAVWALIIWGSTP